MNTRLIRSGQAYWDLAAESYDKVFPDTLVGQAQRAAVWQELERIFHTPQRILELNCGTGIDAIHLAARGVKVLSCDISPRMIELARQRLCSAGVGDGVDFRVLPTEDISTLADEGPFDGAFSNFSGLNCVEDLSAVPRNLARLLKPDSRVLLCMIGRFVPLEMVWHIAHGNPRQALRRFQDRTVTRLADDVMVKVQYPSVGEIARMFAPEFRLRKWTGVGIAVPPSSMEPLARRFPKVLAGLARLDRWLCRVPLFRSMADCVLLQFVRVEDGTNVSS